MTNRIELRDLMETALKAAGTVAQTRVYTARTMPTTKLVHPLILIQTGPEEKQGVSENAKAEFDVTSELAATGRVEGLTDHVVLAVLDALSLQIEKAIISNYQISRLINKISSISMHQDLSGDGKTIIGDVQFIFRFDHTQTAEEFYTVDNSPPLEGVDIHMDTARPFDTTGTYEDPAFPESVTDAPRTTGPDGRDEGALQIDLPQP